MTFEVRQMYDVIIITMYVTEGSASGDPHMTTFDGRRFSWQGVCWYTFFKACTTHPEFEVTAKFEPRVDTEQFKTRTVSFNVTVGNQYAIVNRRNVVTGSIGNKHVDSTVIHIKEDEHLITLMFKSKDTTFTLEWTLSKHLLKTTISGTDYNGKLCGLLGNADGDKRNDFQTPDGIEVSDVTTFGESWKINEIM
uniref:IgGFc-binding protein-like n=1 Tax=Saccoglossus kowalevskii TaxID=10224 RepID=A0ABM0GQC7_SACKO|nr:PREDICTED: IgGFc-binding protein-like [Saccoglossus kowalevskii]